MNINGKNIMEISSLKLLYDINTYVKKHEYMTVLYKEPTFFDFFLEIYDSNDRAIKNNGRIIIFVKNISINSSVNEFWSKTPEIISPNETGYK